MLFIISSTAVYIKINKPHGGLGYNKTPLEAPLISNWLYNDTIREINKTTTLTAALKATFLQNGSGRANGVNLFKGGFGSQQEKQVQVQPSQLHTHTHTAAGIRADPPPAGGGAGPGLLKDLQHHTLPLEALQRESIKSYFI